MQRVNPSKSGGAELQRQGFGPDAEAATTLPLVGRTAEGYRVPEELPLLGAEEPRMDVAAWLQGLGLERYMPAFRDNEIDWEVLPKLTSEDLREIGVAAIGHRRKLLDAIAATVAAVPAADVTASRAGGPALVPLVLDLAVNL
jgi:hypothetical protein